MIFSKKILFFIVFYFAGGFTIGQQIKPDQYRAINWTTEDGLPSGVKHVMLKDEKGFLWVGSSQDGLSRFDGSIFKKYSPDDSTRGAINSVNIHGLTEDSLHNIWIGTGKGLSRYDMRAGTFTNISAISDTSVFSSSILPFWAAKDEVFCVESELWITSYNIHTLSGKKLIQLNINKNGKEFINNYGIFDAASNSIWMEYFEQQGGAVLLQVSLSDGKRKYYQWPCYKKNHSIHGHDFEAMQYDRERNSIWINSGDGLLQFTLSDKQFHLAETFNELIKSKDYDRGVGVETDTKGRIWFSTFYKGIFIYDPETKRIKPVFSNEDLQEKAGGNNFHIYCDPDGIVWTSNWSGRGICELIPSNPSIKRYAANPYKKDSISNILISTILPGPQGKLWIGTNDGLNIFDPQTETFEVLREKDLPGIKGTAIIPLYIDTIRQKAWINATRESFVKYFEMDMYEMDLKTRQCRRIIFRDGPKVVDTFSVPHTLVRPYKGGILFCDEKHGVFEVRQGSLTANLIIPVTPGFGAFTLIDDRYIFLQQGGGIPNYTFENINGKWTKTPHFLDSLVWYCFYYNKNDQTYWINFSNELVHFDKQFRKIQTYKGKDLYKNIILAMQTDKDGKLWMVNMNKDIGRLDPLTGIYSKLRETDGYHKQEYAWYAPVAKDWQGNLYFGIGWYSGAGSPAWGLDRIFPERYASTNKTSAYLQSITINQKPFFLPGELNNMEELQLRHDQNTIRIEVGIIDFYSKEKGNIRYNLGHDGKVTEWQYPLDKIIRYEDMGPGSYRLVIQASNAGGEYIGPEKFLLINISPAFWNTWWFRIVAAIFVLSIFYVVIRYRTQQKFKLQLERTGKEKQIAELGQKTAELQQQKTEIEMQALRAQMNPHFIFNSLNSINRFILQNNKTQASEYLTKFSKLVRMILQNSQAPLITLESELESLELYLNLEVLRFDYHFDYKISVEDDVDISVLKIPPLIVQPYVENAIWHGLMHKEEKGQLYIEISQNNDYLYLKVTDNGIGRKQSTLLASKSATKHKSMGLKITAHRIAMMQDANSNGSTITINDLVAPDGEAVGTEVIIKMPAIYD